MLRPSPVPLPEFLVVKNGSIAWESISGDMPVPESIIFMTTYGPGSKSEEETSVAVMILRKISMVECAAFRHGIAGINDEIQ